MSAILKIIILFAIIVLIAVGIWRLLKPDNSPVVLPDNAPKQDSPSALSKLDKQLSDLDAGFSILEQDDEVSAGIPTGSLATIISKTDTEINRKVEVLSNLMSRISAIKNISKPAQNSLILSVQKEIDQLRDLKLKIDSDTNMPEVINDYRLVADSYEAYNFTLRQTRIVALANEVLKTTDSMIDFGAEIQPRASSLIESNAILIDQLFSDFEIKVKNARDQAKLSADAAVLFKNGEDLNKPQTNLKAAKDSLAAARADLGKIIKYLKEFES